MAGKPKRNAVLWVGSPPRLETLLGCNVHRTCFVEVEDQHDLKVLDGRKKLLPCLLAEGQT